MTFTRASGPKTTVQNIVQQNAYTPPTATSILVCWPDGTNLRGNRVTASQPLLVLTGTVQARASASVPLYAVWCRLLPFS